MRRLVGMLIILAVLACVVPAQASNAEATLVEEQAKLLQAILQLAVELNEADRRLQEMSQLYEDAEADVDALKEEVISLRNQLAEALALYADAEADVTKLRGMTEKLARELEAREVTLEAYRTSTNAKLWLTFIAGVIGGVAGKILIDIVSQ